MMIIIVGNEYQLTDTHTYCVKQGWYKGYRREGERESTVWLVGLVVASRLSNFGKGLCSNGNKNWLGMDDHQIG